MCIAELNAFFFACLCRTLSALLLLREFRDRWARELIDRCHSVKLKGKIHGSSWRWCGEFTTLKKVVMPVSLYGGP
jgi:hypothetical protein